MAANDIEYYNGQPVQLYKVTPTTGDIADGMTAWSTTAYHKRLGSCYFVDADYCHPVKEDTDRLTFQFKAATTGANLISGAFTPFITGTNTSVTTDFLIDAGATFLADGSQLNHFVCNTTTNDSSYIIDLTSETSLELDEDIFTATPQNYEIYDIYNGGGWKYNTSTGLFSMPVAAPTTLTIPGSMTVSFYYKLTINVSSITSGSFTVKFGTNTVATITSAGEHVIYGQCLTNSNLVFTASNTFVGSISDTMDLYNVQTDYSIVVFDLNDTPVTAYPISSTTGISIGNIVVDMPWSDLNLPCGKYVIGISLDTLCPGDMIVNGDLTDGDTGWEFLATSGTVQVVNQQIEFDDNSEGAYAANLLACPIIEGHQYTMTWKVYGVSDILETVEGGYGIFDQLLNQVSPSYAAALQVGQTITLNFTAPADSTFILFSTLGENSTFAIDDITLIDNTISTISEMDSLSECYCVCDPTCTMLIKYYSTRPTFGNYFTSNSTDYMYFRVYGRMRNANNADLELNSFKTTMDNQIQPYLNMNRVEELATQPVPDWVHQSLSVALSHPEVLIDGVRYNRIGGYTPNFGEGELSDVVVNMARYNQGNLRNNY